MRPNQWRQANITFRNGDDAERLTVMRVGPKLREAKDRGLLSAWFFIRKQQWRLRWLPTSPAAADALLHTLIGCDETMSWTTCVCEFETLAFGGYAGMEAACTLFHADSHHLLQWLATDQPLGRRETSALLSSTLLRGAGLDWFEQGDVWARVANLRRTATIPTDIASCRELLDAMRTLMTTDATGLCNAIKLGPLSGFRNWIFAFHHAGQTLARLNRKGRLKRGLRAVLAHHLIFHFNRIGLSTADQAAMAALATTVVFDQDRTPDQAST